ncbi:MAG: hypothetical protein M1820_008795 [Bogoriella megaspora]|nr:MAG: hypothetical protein M1820_008795 [Bogoriella megaspora]
MSGRARDRAPRSSTSSPPSVASSSTISSKLIHRSEELGGPVGTAGRRGNTTGQDGQIIPSYQNGGSLQARGYLNGSAGTNALSGRTQHRQRGGFLLEPAFHNTTNASDAQSHASKGKGRADGVLTPSKNSEPASDTHIPNGVTKASSSLSTNSDFRQDQKRGEGDRDSDKIDGTLSAGNSGKRSSSISDSKGELQGLRKTRDRTTAGRPTSHVSPLRQSGMDASEIVNMALNLSESRRRHLAAGRLASMPISAGRRVASAGLQPHHIALQGSYRSSEQGTTLRQKLQQHEPSSRGVSPAAGRPDSQVSEGSAIADPLDLPLDQTTFLDQPLGYGFHFSSGTLARAEKARKAIELSIEYRRLLQFLPPLTRDSELVTTASHPGSPSVEIRRTFSSAGQQPLGRAFNPLQMIRNRKVRARERKQLNPDTDAWDDVDRARNWVDAVEQQADEPYYRLEDSVALPKFDPETQLKASADQPGSTAKVKRSRLDWTWSPVEAFADAYWLEQGNHRASIENRHGNKLFPNFKPSDVVGVMETGSISSSRHRDQDRVETASISSSLVSPDGHIDDRGRSHKKRNFLHLPLNDSTGKLKRRSWHRSSSRSSMSSNLSTSDHDGAGGQRRPMVKIPTGDEATGPLARHINALIESEQGRVSDKSPLSPDHWDSQQTKQPISNRFSANLDSSTTGDSASPHDHRFWPMSKSFESKRKPRPNIRQEVEGQPRSSFDTLDSTAPSSPTANHFMPGISMELSPPGTRVVSPVHKHKLPRLPFFRHGDDKAKHRIDSTDFAASGHETANKRHSLEVPRTPNRSSFDSYRHTLRHSRSRTADDDISSKAHKNHTSESDGHNHRERSAVGRFLRGGLVGDIVRHEGSRLGDRARRKDSTHQDPRLSETSLGASDVSVNQSDNDRDDSRSGRRIPRLSLERTNTDDEEASTGQSLRPQYHMTNLPSFKHSSPLEKITSASSATSSDADHIQQQQRARRENGQSPRFKDLAPPRIDVSVSGSSSPGLSRTDTRQTDQSRLHDGSVYSAVSRSRSRSRDRDSSDPLGPESKSADRRPAGALGHVPVRSPDKKSSNKTRPQLFKREWSISDTLQEHQVIVNKREIARMKALLLTSGIKANEISRRAFEVRPEKPEFLLKAASVANAPLYPVARKEEHVLAARILSTHLEKTTKDVENAIQRFRNSSVQSLRADLQEVRSKIADDLTPQVHNKADEADAFTAELTSRHTLDIKQLNDYIELMKRRRWRRLRWVRRAGFTLLEWMLLAFMWWVWLIVVVLKVVKNVITGAAGGVRWILWL